MILNWFKREKYIVFNGQTRKFRIIKWSVFILVTLLLFLWKGWPVVVKLWAILAVLGISLHFFLRYKTHGWRQPWGPVKEIKTPFD